MSTITEAQQRLGELLLVGFEGTRLSDDTAAFLSQARIGGVILFTPNYENPEQVAELINQVQDCRIELPLWISVDQEGGRVQRFRDPFTRLPSALSIARSQSPKLAYEVAELGAKELKAVGVNLNFAPVADILTNPENTVIGDRAYGTTEEEVSRIVTGAVRGHVVAGVQPCVKHFPGHGDTLVDSHEDLPRINVPLETLRDREFKPFVKTFKSRCNLVMTAHILNSAIDPDFPATLSKKTLREILRKELRYSKVIMSDDMEMKAITRHYGDEAPILALQAGCDILIYRGENAARHAYEVLRRALEQEQLSAEDVIAASERIRSLKQETLLPYEPVRPQEARTKIGLPEHQALVESCKPC